jgi:hypothetical protein
MSRLSPVSKQKAIEILSYNQLTTLLYFPWKSSRKRSLAHFLARGKQSNNIKIALDAECNNFLCFGNNIKLLPQ